jgi:hypothetical protein
MYMVLSDQSGTVVATGFTGVTFQVVPGQVYTLQADSYGNCNFDDWQSAPGNGSAVTSSSDPITFTASSTIQTPVATYECG